MPKLSNLTYREISKFLRSFGFVMIRQEGSHVAFQNPKGYLVIVPRHGKKIIPLGTVLSILRQAKVTKNEAVKFFSK